MKLGINKIEVQIRLAIQHGEICRPAGVEADVNHGKAAVAAAP